MENKNNSTSEDTIVGQNTNGPSKLHLDVLQKFFGHKSFRPLQWQIIHSVMEQKRDNCVIMATGYGKSLCYQFPAVFKMGLCIVISPLISLMEDQVQALEFANIPACLLGTAQTNKSEAIENMLQGFYRLVYMTPEFAISDYGLELLEKLNSTVNIALLAIDEAHCVSQWGHDFRPSYRGLNKIRETLKTVPVLAVTATATIEVKNDIVKSLKLRSPQLLCTGFDRPNLFFKAEKKSRDSYADIKKVLDNENKIFNITKGSTIIYCLTRKMTEEIVEVLKLKGIKCEAYHAGLSVKVRKSVHEQFAKDDINIIVATIAFGMGIDKPNVRCVIHYGSSSDMEGYYQEAGRAGRDGNPSLCVLYHSPADFVTHEFLRDKSFMSADAKSHKENLNSYMKQYVSSRECRRFLIMSYFDKNVIKPTEHNANCCDNCNKRFNSPHDSARYEGINSDGFYDFSDDTEIFLKVIKLFLPKEFGLGMIISQLKGSKAKKMHPWSLKLESHGSGSSKSEDWWKQIALILEQQNLIKKESRSFGERSFSVICLNTQGEKWLNDKQQSKGKPVLAKPTEDMIPLLKKKITSGSILNTSSQQVSTQSERSSTTLTRDQLNAHQQGLLDVLFEMRHTLAKEKNIMPHVITSDIALHQMAKVQPKTMKRLISEKFDGMSDKKIENFGLQILKKIQQYCCKNPPPILSIEEILAENPVSTSSCSMMNTTINTTQRLTQEMFNEGESPEEIAIKRKLSPSTISSHLSSVLRSTYSLDISRIITASKLSCILKVLEEMKDVSKLTPIKNMCPPVITYDEIKIAISYWDVKNHLKDLNLPHVDKYGLVGEGKNCIFKQVTIKPDEDEALLLDEEVDTKVFKHDSIPIGENGSSKINNADNEIDKNAEPKTTPMSDDDDLWNDQDLFSENMDEIMTIASNYEKTKLTDDNQSNESKFEKSETIECDELLSNENPDSQVENSKNLINEPPVLITKNILKDSVAEQNILPSATKRKLPDWIANAGQAKSVMRAKLSKNSLFN